MRTFYCSILILCWYVCVTIISNRACAQDISLKNPSLEGPPLAAKLPPYWLSANRSPDTWAAKGLLTASDGETFVGIYYSAIWKEGISQLLESPLKAGITYTLSFDLACPEVYPFEVCYATLAVYGGNGPADTTTCFWRSGEIYHKNWKRYTVSFTPTKDCSYLAFWPYLSSPCPKNKNGIAAMIDNFSKYVKAAPKLSLTTRPTCQDAPSGQVAVAVTGAPGPYAYKWLPGGETTDCIASLAAGDYEVTVTAANGLTTRAQATVKVDSLLSHATVTSAPCFDQPEHSIAVNTRGGMPPYRYYFNGSSTGTYTPVFRKLSPGSYHILVKDQRGCSQELNDVVVKGPPQLIIQQSTVIPATCGDMANGRIIPLVQGGTPPYVYQVDNGPWQSDSVLQDLSSGYHSFNVKDKYQCITSGTADVATQWPNCLVMMPSAFSPNGDGINDVFRPKVYDEVLNYELAIYNRWGGLVFRSNDPYRGWDGIYKGLLQEVQGFTYICTFLDRNNMRQELRGVVMLVH